MKPRSEYKTIIEYFIPKTSLPGDADQQWNYLMAILRDVYAQYPDAGITVTCTSVARRLEVSGTDREPVEQLIAKSEQKHKFW